MPRLHPRHEREALSTEQKSPLTDGQGTFFIVCGGSGVERHLIQLIFAEAGVCRGELARLFERAALAAVVRHDLERLLGRDDRLRALVCAAQHEHEFALRRRLGEVGHRAVERRAQLLLMELGQLARERDLPRAAERVAQVAERAQQLVRRFVEDHRARLAAQALKMLAPGLAAHGEEALEAKLLRRQAGHGQRRDGRARAGDDLHVDALLGALALMRLWRDEIPRRRLFKALGWAAGVTGGLCLLLAVAGGSLFDFGREESAAMMTEQFHQILKANNMQEYLDRGMDAEMGIATADAMAAERASMMQADAWRSLLMILLAAGGVALFALRRINKYALTALLGAVMLLDLVPVDLRFLSHDDFISARRRQITATAADKAILADKDPGFRVLNLTVSPFQDATTSYFHRSVGGYHGAKLARYQDLIDRYLSYRNDAVLDMLNTRYLIVPGDDGQPQAVRRATANGPAWFVEGIVAADTPQQEIDLLGSVDLKTTAVAAPADKAFAEEWQAGGQADTTLVRGIALTEYRPNYQKYEYTAPEESVAVFSEIFYDHGWTAYVDGEAMPGFRADYILRAMKLPAGRHTVEWRFRAPGWAAAEAVTLVSSLLILLGAAAALIYCFRKKKA